MVAFEVQLVTYPPIISPTIPPAHEIAVEAGSIATAETVEPTWVSQFSTVLVSEDSPREAAIPPAHEVVEYASLLTALTVPVNLQFFTELLERTQPAIPPAEELDTEISSISPLAT